MLEPESRLREEITRGDLEQVITETFEQPYDLISEYHVTRPKVTFILVDLFGNPPSAAEQEELEDWMTYGGSPPDLPIIMGQLVAKRLLKAGEYLIRMEY